jgi:hypothetical protein
MESGFLFIRKYLSFCRREYFMEQILKNSASGAALDEKEWTVGCDVERIGKYLVRSTYTGEEDITNLMVCYAERVASLRY